MPFSWNEARMPVPKFACEVSNAFRFVWSVGGEGDIGRKKHCESVIRPYFHQEGEFRNAHERYVESWQLASV